MHWKESKAVADLIDSVQHGGKHFIDGPLAMFHRLADATVDGFGPLVEKLTACVDSIEERLFQKAHADLVREAMSTRREVFALKQRFERQRTAIDRLARREIVDVSAEMAFRLRDVGDHLVSLTDAALALDHRLSGVLTAAAGLTGGRRWM